MAIDFAFKISAISSDIDLRVINFTAREWISKPFKVNLKLASKNDIDFDEVLAKNALLTISSTYDGDTKDRYFYGIIQKFEKVNYNNTRKRFIYKAVLVPDLWRLSLRKGYRIFQGLPVLRKMNDSTYTTSIVEKILKNASIGFTPTTDLKTLTVYPARDYCAQYSESDLNFISRLLEDEGIFYYFEHTDTDHKVIFGDNHNNYNISIGTILFHEQTGTEPENDYVYNFKLSRQIHSGKVTLRDFDFAQSTDTRLPEKNLDIQDGDVIKSTASEGDGSADPPVPPKFQKFHDLEEYNYPGSYTHYDSTAPATTKDGVMIHDHLDDSRLEEAAIYRDRATGKSVCARFCPGFTFTLTGHDEFDDNNKDSSNNEKDYVLTEVTHSGSNPLGSGDTSFSNTFKGIPSTVTFRPERKTPKAVVRGPQTAIIVDVNGNTEYNSRDPQADGNVYTDSYGRVKVRFHWERSHPEVVFENGMSKKDNNGQIITEDKWFNTAWVRVSQAWAGQGWGSMHIPHVGQEVIVDFLDGDPDRPIITGRVYNEENKPFDDPGNISMRPGANNHVSGFQDEYGNAIYFDANKDKEKVILKSPANDSYITLGHEGITLKTIKEMLIACTEPIFEAGAGTKIELFGGGELGIKLAQMVEFVFGQQIEFFMGNKMELGFGTEFEYKKTKEIKAVEGDIESESKKDHKLIAGDGFCIIGGKGDEGDQGEKTISIMNAYSDGLMLSYGDKKDTEGTETGLDSATWWSFGIFTILGLITSIGAKTFQAIGGYSAVPEVFGGENFSLGEDIGIGGETGFGVATGALAIAQAVVSTILAAVNNDSVEPAYHEKPKTVIGMNEGGITLGINPKLTKTTGLLPMLKTGRDQILTSSVSTKADKKAAKQRFAQRKKEIWKQFITEALDEETENDSRIMMNNDSSIMINSNGDSKNIELFVGPKDNVDSGLRLSDEGVGINGGSSATIAIGKDKDIEITSGKGSVVVQSEKGNVDLIASKKVRAKGMSFDINGALKHKYFEVLA